MADYNLVTQALGRGYSMDEIADKLSEAAGFDPAAIRARGYSSDEMLGKLGYVAPPAPPDESTALGNAGRLLKMGVNTAAQDVRELVGKIPVIGEPIQSGLDWVDEKMHGMSSDELLKTDNAAMQAKLGPAMKDAIDKKWWDSTTNSFGNAWFDPRAYEAGLLQSLPEEALMIFPAMRLAKGAYAAKIAAGATEKVAALAAARTAQIAGSVIEGSLGGAQSSRMVRDEILDKTKITDEALATSDAYKALLEQGMDPDQARKELANSQSAHAFITSGVATGVFGGMGDRLLAKIIIGKSLGAGARFAAGAASEGLVEEFPQSYLQQVAQNEAIQKADPTKPLTEDALNQALQGAATGALQGGGMAAAFGEKGTPQPVTDPTKSPILAANSADEAINTFNSDLAQPAGFSPSTAEQAAPPIQEPLAQPIQEAQNGTIPVPLADGQLPAGSPAISSDNLQGSDATVLLRPDTGIVAGGDIGTGLAGSTEIPVASIGQNQPVTNTGNAPVDRRTNTAERDALYDNAVGIVTKIGHVSVPLIQRQFGQIPYARAKRLVDQMEADGIVGKQDSNGRHEILKLQELASEQAANKPISTTESANASVGSGVASTDTGSQKADGQGAGDLSATLKPAIEQLIKRKSAATQLHLGMHLGIALGKAKSAMESGTGKASDFTKIAAKFKGKDDQTYTILNSIANALEPAKTVTSKPKQAAQSLIPRLRQLGGVSLSHLKDITGESDVRRSGAVGIFSKNGRGLDALATILKDDGFNINTDDVDGGVQQLRDMISEALHGHDVLTFAGQEAKLLADQEAEHRDGVKKQAESLGIKTVGRKFNAIEALVMKQIAKEQTREEDTLTDEEYIAADEAMMAFQDLLGEEAKDAIYNEVSKAYGDKSVKTFYAELTRRFTEAAHDYETRSAGEVARAAQGKPGQGDQTGSKPTGAGENALTLESQTNAEALAQEQAAAQRARDEAAQAKKAQSDKDAADLAARTKAHAENPDNFQFGENSKQAAAPVGDLFNQKPASEMTASELLRAAADKMDLAAKPVEAQPAKGGSVKPLYASRPVSNAKDIIAWAESQGFKSTLPASDMHVTVAYSSKPMDGDKMSGAPNSIKVNGGKRTVEPLGDKGAVVLKFSSDDLQSRWQEYRNAGASWDYDGYTPHVTLTYKGGDIDLSKVVPYSGRIELGAEKQDSLNTDKQNEYVEVPTQEPKTEQPTEQKPVTPQVDIQQEQAQILTFEQYAAINGASRQGIGEAALHRSSNKKSPNTHRRQVEAQAREDHKLILRRGELQKEYDKQVAEGKIRPPSQKETIIETANGMPELEATQAARRIAEKRGWDWQEQSVKFSTSSDLDHQVHLLQDKYDITRDEARQMYEAGDRIDERGDKYAVMYSRNARENIPSDTEAKMIAAYNTDLPSQEEQLRDAMKGNYWPEGWEYQTETVSNLEDMYGDDRADWPKELVNALGDGNEVVTVSEGGNFEYYSPKDAPSEAEFNDRVAEEIGVIPPAKSLDEMLDESRLNGFLGESAVSAAFKAMAKAEGWNADERGTRYFDIWKDNPDPATKEDNPNITLHVRVSDHSKTAGFSRPDRANDIHINIAPSDGRGNEYHGADTFESALWTMRNASLDADGNVLVAGQEPGLFSKGQPTTTPHTVESLKTALLEAHTGKDRVALSAMMDAGKAKVITADEAKGILSGNTTIFESPVNGRMRNADKSGNLRNTGTISKHLDSNINIPKNTELRSGGVNATTNKGTSDGVFLDSEGISDLLKTLAFKVKGFSGLDAEARGRVLDQMFLAGQNSKVLDSVVRFIPVDVMDVLSREQLTPEMLFHDKAMLLDALSGDGIFSGHVSPVSVANFIRKTASVRAKIDGSNFALVSQELIPAIRAEDGNFSRHDFSPFGNVDSSIQGVHAFYNPKDGISYFVADNISKQATPESLRGLINHEISVHALNLGKTSKEFQAILKQVEVMRKMGNKKILEAYARVPQDTPAGDVSHEALAYAVQHSPELGIVKKFIAWFREQLRAIAKAFPIGKQLKFNKWVNSLQVDDLQYMAQTAMSRAHEASQAQAGDYRDSLFTPSLDRSGAPLFTKQNQTDTPAFKAWFGNSKVVDTEGKPLVVYHSTNDEWASFDARKTVSSFGFHAGTKDQAEAVRETGGTKSDVTKSRPIEGMNVMPIYLKIINPLRMEDKGAWYSHQMVEDLAKIGIEDKSILPNNSRELAGYGASHMDLAWERASNARKHWDLAVKEHMRTWRAEHPDLGRDAYDEESRVAGRDYVRGLIEKAGYDGIVYDNKFEGKGDSYIAFNPTQIKSAIGNRGTFDSANPNILFSTAPNIIGDTGRARTPEQLAAFKNVGRSVTTPTVKERMQDLWKDAGKKLAQGLVDQFRPIRDLSTEAYALMRLSKGSSGAFEVLLNGGQLKLNEGVYDFDEANKGGVVDRLLIPLQGEADDFLWWVAANRAEKLSTEDREHLFTSEDIEAMKTLADGETSFDFTLQNGQTTRNRAEIYADSLKTFNEFNKNTLDMAEQSGLIDGESRKLWESEFYVPFYRVEEDGVRGMNIKSGVVRQQAFKQLKGGTQKLNSDLLDNTLMNWAHLLDAAAKNRAAKASLEAAELIGVATEVMEPAKKSVWFMDGGQKRHFIVNDPYVLDALIALEYAGMKNPVMNAMGTMKHALTVGVTASPFFKVRNLIRDSVQSIAVSGLDLNVAANIKEGWKLTNPKSDAYFRLLAGGGTIHFGTMFEGSESRRVRSLVEAGVDESTILDSESKYAAFYKRMIEPSITAYNELGNRGEAVNRASLYDQLRKQGKGHAEASLMARDLMDFSMQGAWTSIRFLNQTVPFLNARLQGLYKLGRAAQDDPKRLGVVLGATALASIAMMLAYNDDDDWKKREDWDRDNYWWFKIGGEAFRIPKPFEIGAIASLAERGVELFASDEMTGERFMSRLWRLTSDNLSLNPVPQLVKPILDVYANKDSFTGRPIETMGMERLDPEYRYTQRTSMVARAAGEFGASPVQVDHLIRGYFGWLGTFVVGSADVIAKPLTGQIPGAEPDYMKKLTGGMVADLEDAPSRYVSKMYEQSKVIEQAYGTWRYLLKTNPESAIEYRAENVESLNKYRAIEQAKRAETALNLRIRMIERSTKSPEEKRMLIRNINERKDMIARRVN